MMKQLLLATAVTAGLFVFSSPMTISEAEACNCVSYSQYSRHADRNTDDIKQTFTSRIDRMQEALTAIIVRSTAQMVTTMKEQVQGQAQIAQTTDEREVVRKIEEARFQAMLDAQTGAMACNVITGSASMGAQPLTIAAITHSVVSEADDWDQGRVGGGSGGFAPSGSSRDAAQNARLAMNSAFCDADMARVGLCEITRPPEQQGATLNPGKSIFSMGSYSPDILLASEGYMKNSLNPDPQGTFRVSSFEIQPEQARREFAQRQAVLTRKSMAENYIADVIARRTPQETLVGDGDGASTRVWWAEATASDVVGYDPGGGNFKNGVSWHDYMELRSQAWFNNPNFWQQVNDGNASQNIKSLMMINSFLVVQQWETYKLLQRIGAIEATKLALMVDEAD